MRHGSLFSGIGGFDLAAEWMGWENVFHCDNDKFCQRILKYYWPNAEAYDDIREADFKRFFQKIDVLTGGFPCQPFSNSGQQLGESDERFLFKEMLRAIREIKPRWIVAENVRSITAPKFKKIFAEIYSSLEFEGYEILSLLIPATAVGAEHERYRVWIIAYSKCARLQGQGSLLGQLQSAQIGDRETSGFVNFIQKNAMPFVCSSHNGLSRELVEKSLHGIGNAIVPQIAYEIFKAIGQFEGKLSDK